MAVSRLWAQTKKAFVQMLAKPNMTAWKRSFLPLIRTSFHLSILVPEEEESH